MTRFSVRWRAVVPLLLAAALLAPPALAEQAPAPAPADAADDALIEPAARAAVKRMVEALTGAERMSYEYASSYDALQDDGEMLEFGTRGAVTIRRPDRMRAEIWHRDGRHVQIAWDGASLAFLDETAKVYASTPRTGDLDSLIDFLREGIGLRLPTADLFTSDLGPMLVENVVAARSIGKEWLDETEVEHVALRLRTGVDVQLWIATGEHALPARMVLDFATADGRPAFRAEFHEWDLDPRARDSHFVLKQPKDARRVEFMAERKRRTDPAVEEGSK